MNLFKPRRTFESVVRELVTGLEDGSIALSKESATPPSKNQTVESLLCSGSLGIKIKANPARSRTPRHYKFVAEWVGVDLPDVHKELPIVFGPSISAPIRH